MAFLASMLCGVFTLIGIVAALAFGLCLVALSFLGIAWVFVKLTPKDGNEGPNKIPAQTVAPLVGLFISFAFLLICAGLVTALKPYTIVG